MRLNRLIAALVLILFTAVTAKAALYKYTDDQGKLHVVDNPSKIPDKYKKNQEKVKRSDPMRSTVPTRPRRGVPKKRPERSRTPKGPTQKEKIEQYRAKKKKIEKEIKYYEDLIADINNPRWDRITVGGKAVKVGDSAEDSKSIRKFEKKLDRLRKKLKQLYKDARADGVPRGQINRK